MERGEEGGRVGGGEQRGPRRRLESSKWTGEKVVRGRLESLDLDGVGRGRGGGFYAGAARVSISFGWTQGSGAVGSPSRKVRGRGSSGVVSFPPTRGIRARWAPFSACARTVISISTPTDTCAAACLLLLTVAAA